MNSVSKRLFVAGGLGLAVALSGMQVQAQDSAENSIKYRQGIMRNNGGHLGALSAIAKGEVSNPGHAVGHAQALAAQANMLADLFPDGSGPESGVQTRALPAIWEQPDKLQEIVGMVQAEAAKLVEAAQSGDLGAIGAQLGVLGRDGCGACHTAFRAPQN